MYSKHGINVTSDILESSPIIVNINHVSLYLRCIEVSTTNYYKTHLHNYTNTNKHPLNISIKAIKTHMHSTTSTQNGQLWCQHSLSSKINKMAN